MVIVTTGCQKYSLSLGSKSLNMYLLLITLEINSSGRAVTGPRCYWQNAVAVTDNMSCLRILHCNLPIRLSLSLWFYSSAPHRALLSSSVRWVEKWYTTQAFVGATIHWNEITLKEIAREEWATTKDEGLRHLWNKCTLEGTRVQHIGTNWKFRKKERKTEKGKIDVWTAFVIEVNSVWFESNICGNALELASEALKSAFGMGSYLQGFPFSGIKT